MRGSEFSIEIPVHFSDSDRTGHMSPVSVMRAMIESSMRHSESVRPSDFHDVWVLYQWDVDFHYFPKPGTRLVATTWTTGFYKFYAYRHFRLEEADKCVAEAKTTWLLLSGDTGRPRRVPPLFAEQYGSDLLEGQPRDAKEVLPFVAHSNLEIRVRKYEMDVNQHVNNLVYADWILEAVPEPFRNEHQLEKLILTYRKQVVYPETMNSQISEPDLSINHRIVDGNQEVRTWGRTRWRKK